MMMLMITTNLARTVLLEEAERNKTPRGEHEDRRVTAVMVVLYQKPNRSAKRDLPRDQESLLPLRIHPFATMRKSERADGVQGPRDPEWKVFLELNHLMGLNLLVGTETKRERNADPPDPLDLELKQSMDQNLILGREQKLASMPGQEHPQGTRKKERQKKEPRDHLS
jgi:hypothetical protein